ncbi:sensor histidine kinase [Legionella hackeliae]|uniref:histidine kinase n=1 Tax=Legionella hackeliae TaxID=449 RepID=A0A0A8UUR1_LEGHA|nr:ATP-binding protein [Legionella hackeliae]KTD15391.1 sensor kinase HydH [Legionella hackeliae]CEK11241.1 Sensor histidine kinase [Legionella hackeliae]STX48007.1 sensor kinase HydH [Legionella hackeliae]
MVIKESLCREEFIDIPAQDILASLPCGLLVLNANGKIIWLNTAAEALLGANLRGASWREVIQQAFAPREDDGHEVSLVDGRRVRVAISSLDNLPGQLVILTDLTATRVYEQAKANQHRLMSIGRMTAQLAHQIRTPLSSAILYSEHLAAHPEMDSRCLQWILRLQECHASIEQQIQDLLLFARGETIELSPVRIQDWLNQLMERAQPLIEAQSAKLSINNTLMGNKEVLLHIESLTGALLNLIINALQAKASFITVDILEPEKSKVQIKVTDNGMGMSDEVKSQAFAPFFTTKAQGTGLGLAVVNAVVNAHDGEVVLDSSSGQGSCITINLPG